MTCAPLDRLRRLLYGPPGRHTRAIVRRVTAPAPRPAAVTEADAYAAIVAAEPELAEHLHDVVWRLAQGRPAEEVTQ